MMVVSAQMLRHSQYQGTNDFHLRSLSFYVLTFETCTVRYENGGDWFSATFLAAKTFFLEIGTPNATQYGMPI